MSKKNIKGELIIQAATGVLSKDNFRNSTVSPIGQEADVAAGRIYQNGCSLLLGDIIYPEEMAEQLESESRSISVKANIYQAKGVKK